MVKLDKQNREQYINLILDELYNGKKEAFRQTFLELHPSDQADIFHTLEEEMRKRVYQYLTPEEFAEIFEGLTISNKLNFFTELDDEYSSAMFNNMFTDDVVTFLSGMEQDQAESILSQLEKEKAQKVRDLLSYAKETAGAVMTKELISIASKDTAGQVIEQLRGEAPNAEIIYYNYVVNRQGELVGVVSLRDLIVASPTAVIEDVMSKRIVSVPDDMDQEDVANTIKKYDFLAVPVVSKQNKLLGIITVDDIIDILEAETTEDFGELSATKGATDVSISPLKAAKKRSPWIILLMGLGLITGGVIQQFEETLESVVLLAFFIPMIMDSGGNVGTQSLAVSVRGLALGTIEKGDFWRIIRREFSTGALMGLVCMAIISVIVLAVYGNGMLGLIVGVSILCTLSMSAIIGAVVPLIINKFKIDPAVASGPFITTLNDVIGLLIYFSIATTLIDKI